MDVMLCACVVVTNEDGEVLAVSRRHDHTKFGLLGGKVDPEDIVPDMDETLRRCAVREAMQEGGIIVDPSDLIPLVMNVCKDETGKDRDSISMTYWVPPRAKVIWVERKENEPPMAWVPWSTLCQGGAFSKYNSEVRSALDNLVSRM